MILVKSALEFGGLSLFGTQSPYVENTSITLLRDRNQAKFINVCTALGDSLSGSLDSCARQTLTDFKGTLPE